MFLVFSTISLKLNKVFKIRTAAGSNRTKQFKFVFTYSTVEPLTPYFAIMFGINIFLRWVFGI